jgi:hypothetical protein
MPTPSAKLIADSQVFLVDDLFREAPVGGFVFFG